MDQNALQTAEHPGVCPVCHQPVLPSYYFCPNCGAKVHEPPLPISTSEQLWLYAFSIILPVMFYIAITKWKGIVYLRSKDEKARQIGAFACGLLLISTFVTYYYEYEWTQQALQQATTQVNQEMGL